MKYLFLVCVLFFSIWNIANAIPIPALAIWYEFVLLMIPSVLAFYSFILFYFRKYIFYINVYTYISFIFLYFVHYYITQEFVLYDKEYILFFFLLGIIILIYKIFKLHFLNYFLIPLLLSFNFFIININYHLYEFKKISNCIELNMYINVEIKNILYKDNFFVVYWYDRESSVSAYSIVENSLLDEKFYLNKWKYYIVYWWNRWLWKWLSDLSYNCIK